MNIRIGYYAMFDMILALREIYSVERFKPFCNPVEELMHDLNEDDMNMINEVGDASRGWLKIIEIFISDAVKGITSPEELLIKINDEAKKYFCGKDNLNNIEAFNNLWKKQVLYQINRNSVRLTDEAMNIANKIKKTDAISYLTLVSDRIILKDKNTLKFNIKPDFEVNINEIDNIIIMPSIYGCRNLTFWNNGNDFIFYISINSHKDNFEEPSDMLLLNTLAFDDRTRLKMLRFLTIRPYSVNELAEIIAVNASTISRHMKVFKDTGFVDVQNKDGNIVYYLLNKNQVKRALSSIYKYITGEEF